MSTHHEHPTSGTFVQRTVRTVVPYVTAFLIALLAAKIVGLLTENPWARLGTALGVAVVSLLLHTYEDGDEDDPHGD
ncbi:hypothetical protein [Streptomyces virginiae]|uniref:hypothetical protein n=1 Tax=Streptomyces virginiae TaxID=1961 RepID=UPI00225AF989|nr:hypothetical protein [Streptomyces virginiae]MCX4962793.1 hypothetical protein [Streptomyces virginiae]WTB24615.1 hypothetical protein OG253_25800 [Streptomyces virginiae]